MKRNLFLIIFIEIIICLMIIIHLNKDNKIKKYIVNRSNNRYSITYNANGRTGSINRQIVLM